MEQSGHGDSPGVTGCDVTIVKLRPNGSHAAEYPATLVSRSADWIVARATWTFRRMEFDYLTFAPGDILYEYFALQEPFNAFALFTPEQYFKGWYCNITYPTTVDDQRIYWHDLYVDVVQQADGNIRILDEDELHDAGLRSTNPDLHRMILKARDTVVEKMRSGDYPFSEFELPRP
jgi:protein associated with RNAse G/E